MKIFSWCQVFRIVGGKEVNPKYKLPYQVLVSVSYHSDIFLAYVSLKLIYKYKYEYKF